MMLQTYAIGTGDTLGEVSAEQFAKTNEWAFGKWVVSWGQNELCERKVSLAVKDLCEVSYAILHISLSPSPDKGWGDKARWKPA